MVRGGLSNQANAQIGHGGLFNLPAAGGTLGGEVAVSAVGDILVESGARDRSYGQIGHGGFGNQGGTPGGRIDVASSGGFVRVITQRGGSDAYAQIGHGGTEATGSRAGDICVHADSGVVLDSSAASGDENYVAIGNGGFANVGDHTGDVTVVSSNGGVSLTAGGSNERYAHIGNGGLLADGNHGGDIRVIAGGGDLLITGGVGASNAYSLVGHGDGSETASGTREGGVHLFASDEIVVSDLGNGFAAWAWHRTNGGLAFPGSYQGGDGFEIVADGGVTLPTPATAGVRGHDQRERGRRPRALRGVQRSRHHGGHLAGGNPE